MNKKVIKKLDKISKLAQSLELSGTIIMPVYTTEKQFDKLLDTIIEYPIYRNNVQITPRLSVTLVWGE